MKPADGQTDMTSPIYVHFVVVAVNLVKCSVTLRNAVPVT